MKDTNDMFVDEIREYKNIGSYSSGIMSLVIEREINASWSARGKENTNIYLRSLIRGLKDLRNA